MTDDSYPYLPGPWWAQPSKEGVAIVQGDDNEVCHLSELDYDDQNVMSYTASLIAAAPMMLTALVRAYHLLVEMGYPPIVTKPIAQAIGTAHRGTIPDTWESIAKLRMHRLGRTYPIMRELAETMPPEGEPADDWWRWIATASVDLLLTWACTIDANKHEGT